MINHSSAMKNYTSSSIENVQLILRVAVSAAARRCACFISVYLFTSIFLHSFCIRFSWYVIFLYCLARLRCTLSLRPFDCGRKGVVSRCLMCSSLRVSLNGNPMFSGPLSDVISRGTPNLGVILDRFMMIGLRKNSWTPESMSSVFTFVSICICDRGLQGTPYDLGT